MRRGEVWWANMDLPVGRRPVVLLSRDSAYDIRNAVTVAPVTRTIRGLPVEVVLDETDGMAVKCAANVDDIATIRKSLLTERITQLGQEKIGALNRAIIVALDIR